VTDSKLDSSPSASTTQQVALHLSQRLMKNVVIDSAKTLDNSATFQKNGAHQKLLRPSAERMLLLETADTIKHHYRVSNIDAETPD